MISLCSVSCIYIYIVLNVIKHACLLYRITNTCKFTCAHTCSGLARMHPAQWVILDKLQCCLLTGGCGFWLIPVIADAEEVSLLPSWNRKKKCSPMFQLQLSLFRFQVDLLLHLCRNQLRNHWKFSQILCLDHVGSLISPGCRNCKANEGLY